MEWSRGQGRRGLLLLATTALSLAFLLRPSEVAEIRRDCVEEGFFTVVRTKGKHRRSRRPATARWYATPNEPIKFERRWEFPWPSTKGDGEFSVRSMPVASVYHKEVRKGFRRPPAALGEAPRGGEKPPDVDALKTPQPREDVDGGDKDGPAIERIDEEADAGPMEAEQLETSSIDEGVARRLQMEDLKSGTKRSGDKASPGWSTPARRKRTRVAPGATSGLPKRPSKEEIDEARETRRLLRQSRPRLYLKNGRG